jgi:hypothetical protein
MAARLEPKVKIPRLHHCSSQTLHDLIHSPCEYVMRMRCDKGSNSPTLGGDDRRHDERRSWVRMTDQIRIAARTAGEPAASPAKSAVPPTAEVAAEHLQLGYWQFRVDGAAVDLIQALRPEPRIMRYELSDYESTKLASIRIWLRADGSAPQVRTGPGPVTPPVIPASSYTPADRESGPDRAETPAWSDGRSGCLRPALLRWSRSGSACAVSGTAVRS